MGMFSPDENGWVREEKYYQLKAENEELKEQYKLAEPLFQACKIKDLKIDKYKTILDEIEEILNIYFDDDWKATREIEQLIKHAKEGE